jgi:hypothetical protein
VLYVLTNYYLQINCPQKQPLITLILDEEEKKKKRTKPKNMTRTTKKKLQKSETQVLLPVASATQLQLQLQLQEVARTAGLAAPVDHGGDDGVEDTNHGVDVGDEQPLPEHPRCDPAGSRVRPHDPELEQRLDGGGGEAGRQGRGHGGGGVAGPEQHEDRLEHGVRAAAALGGRHHRGQVARGGRVGQRDGVHDHAGRRQRQHGPAAAGAGGGGGLGSGAQQVHRLGGVERGEQRGEHGGVGEQQREAVGELRARHRRVRRAQELSERAALVPAAAALGGVRWWRRAVAAAVHGAGLGQEQEGEREGRGGEGRAGALRQAVAEQEEQLRRRREASGHERPAQAPREQVRSAQHRRVRPRQQRRGGEWQRQQRRRRVVVPDEGVQRRADHLAGAAHHHHPHPTAVLTVCASMALLAHS